MRALELLGKITDVGLFSEKTEITIKHQSTEELEKRLYEKLEKVIDVEEAEIVEPMPKLQSPDMDRVHENIDLEGKSFSEQRKLIKPEPVKK